MSHTMPIEVELNIKKTCELTCQHYSTDTWKLTRITRVTHAYFPVLTTVCIQACTFLLLAYFRSILWIAIIVSQWLGKQTKTKRTALILPPSFPGSLGDETMMRVTIDEILKMKIDTVRYLSAADKHEWDFMNPKLASAGVSLMFPWHGAFSPLSIFKTVRAIQLHDYFFCIGADVIDGAYSEIGSRLRIALTNAAAKFGNSTTILGSSFNAHPVCSVVQDLRRLSTNVRICARDPISHERLQICTGRHIEEVADVAFLLKSEEPTNNDFLDWLLEQKTNNQLVIGINPSIHNAMSYEGGSDRIIKMYIQTITDCAEMYERICFVLIPHDTRKIDANSDRTMATLILEGLPVSLKKKVQIVPPVFSQSELQFICSKLDCTITGRMHLAIKCLNTGVPVFCITYQDKFEGLLQMFKLRDCSIPSEEVMHVPSLSSHIQKTLNTSDATKQQIASSLPDIRRRSKANFSNL